MSSAENKKLLQHIFAELANGNAAPFAEAMADEFRPVGGTESDLTGGNAVVLSALRRGTRGRRGNREQHSEHQQASHCPTSTSGAMTCQH